MMTGQAWLALVAVVGSEGANYQTLEFHGPALAAFPLEDRLVFSNMAVETGAKGAIFPSDDLTVAYLHGLYAREADAGCRRPRRALARGRSSSRLRARAARGAPTQSRQRRERREAMGTPVHTVFLGTCTGGRVPDFHERSTSWSAWRPHRSGRSSSSHQRPARRICGRSRTGRSRSWRRWRRRDNTGLRRVLRHERRDPVPTA